MKMKLAVVVAVIAAHGVVAQTPPPAPTPAVLQTYPPVSADLLQTPPDGDWPVVRRTYEGWGYSPLQQITPANVARLQPVWSMSTGMTSGHQAPPIVHGG